MKKHTSLQFFFLIMLLSLTTLVHADHPKEVAETQTVAVVYENVQYIIIGFFGIIAYIFLFLSIEKNEKKELKSNFIYLLVSCASLTISYTLFLSVFSTTFQEKMAKMIHAAALFSILFVAFISANLAGAKTSKKVKAAALIIAGITAALLLFTNAMIQGVIIEEGSHIAKPDPGAYYIYYLGIIMAFSVAPLFLMFKKNKKESQKKLVQVIGLFSLLIICNIVYYMVFRFTSPYLALFTPVSLCIVVGYTLFESKIVNKEKSRTLTLFAITLIVIISIFVFNTFQTTKNIENNVISLTEEGAQVSRVEALESLSQTFNKIWLFTFGTILSIMVVGLIFNSIITKSLRKEVEEKTKELQESNKKLEKTNKHLLDLDKAKSNFLNVVSHELKTPLTAIFAYLDIIEDIKRKMSKDEKKAMEAISRNSHLLKSLINNILEISRIQAGKFEIINSEINLKEKIKECVENLTPLAKNKGIKLLSETKKSPEIIFSDDQRLEEIINNLVSNAIKFTDSGSVTIKATKKGTFVKISVIDTGVGISRENVKKLGQKFYQVDASISRKFEGTGLGLSITKQLAELQGGRIEVKSKPGKGSTFSVILPIKAKQQKVNKKAGEEEKNKNKKTKELSNPLRDIESIHKQKETTKK